MIVCAHMNIGPYIHLHEKAPSIKVAVAVFRHTLELHYGVLDLHKRIAEICGTDDMPCVDLYPACTDETLHCTDQMNFHDYLMARYQVGVRGGVRRVIV